ncbi:BrnA antitoxin family protein [Desulfonatronum lacustre]|uniref:BrnA antitoxin family protein n=1 Tax=Desulfonatronum lacustre TaxID=66849 RepID=UPI0004B2C8E4|nr:BrnA antitoxin family protein [Desulfonatronum lacustre]
MNKILTAREDILAATRNPPPGGDYVWDGQDEADRPLARKEIQAALEVVRKGRGRPKGSGTKEQVAVRFDKDILEVFRAAGPGWQTRMNDALRDWLRTHSST